MHMEIRNCLVHECYQLSEVGMVPFRILAALVPDNLRQLIAVVVNEDNIRLHSLIWVIQFCHPFAY